MRKELNLESTDTTSLCERYLQTLISRNFRGDVPIDIVSEFKSKVIHAEDVRFLHNLDLISNSKQACEKRI